MELVRKAKLTSKGQVTIPIEIREALKLREGDVLSFEIDDEGARLRPEREDDPFSRWAGALREGEGKTIEEINEELREQRGW